MKVFFRPHHFLCTVGFQGMGYSPKFIENYKGIVEILHSDEECPIQVISATDSICSACPHQRGEACTTEAKIQRLDDRHQEILGLSEGDCITWKKAKERIREQMTLENFHHACEGCEWKSLGVCESALKNLRKENGAQKTNL